jgi:prephenate dehydratase
VYEASKTSDYAVLPLENTLQGAVLETVDALLSPLVDDAFPSLEYLYPPSPTALPTPSSLGSFGSPPPPKPEQPHVVADTTLPISHQLVGLRGARLEDIQYIRSHEQALGQCSAWLDEHLPHAERVRWPSTAGALTSVLAQGDKRGAAICSRAAVEREGNRVNVLAEGVQGVKSECAMGGRGQGEGARLAH